MFYSIWRIIPWCPCCSKSLVSCRHRCRNCIVPSSESITCLGWGVRFGDCCFKQYRALGIRTSQCITIRYPCQGILVTGVVILYYGRAIRCDGYRFGRWRGKACIGLDYWYYIGSSSTCKVFGLHENCWVGAIQCLTIVFHCIRRIGVWSPRCSEGLVSCRHRCRNCIVPSSESITCLGWGIRFCNGCFKQYRTFGIRACQGITICHPCQGIFVTGIVILYYSRAIRKYGCLLGGW